MVNLSRFDPFGGFAQLNPLGNLDELWRDLGGRRLGERQAAPAIALDVTETDQAYQVRAEIPGVKKEDIKVEVRGNHVSVSAESRRESEQKEGSRVVRSELYYGQQQRSFTLEQEIDDTRAEAKYVDGILELTLPKRTAGAPSKVQVQ